MSELQRVCEWCSGDFTVVRSGPGRPPPYCSEQCKQDAQLSLAAKRKLRQRQAEQDTRNPWDRNPAGRPRKG
jgi:hypothetical protein